MNNDVISNILITMIKIYLTNVNARYCERLIHIRHIQQKRFPS